MVGPLTQAQHEATDLRSFLYHNTRLYWSTLPDGTNRRERRERIKTAATTIQAAVRGMIERLMLPLRKLLSSK